MSQNWYKLLKNPLPTETKLKYSININYHYCKQNISQYQYNNLNACPKMIGWVGGKIQTQQNDRRGQRKRNQWRRTNNVRLILLTMQCPPNAMRWSNTEKETKPEQIPPSPRCEAIKYFLPKICKFPQKGLRDVQQTNRHGASTRKTRTPSGINLNLYIQEKKTPQFGPREVYFLLSDENKEYRWINTETQAE